MSETRIARLASPTRARDCAQVPAMLRLDSCLLETNWGGVAEFRAADRGENPAELRLREIRIARLDRVVGKDNLIGFLPRLPFDDMAAARKLPLPPCLAAQEKHLGYTSPRKGCRSRRWRRVRREPRDNNPLDLNVNFLVLATCYSLAIGPKVSDQRPTRPCFVESKGLIRSKMSEGCSRKRIWVKDFGVGANGRKAHRRASREKEASTVESYLITSDAGDAFSSNKNQVMSMSYDGDQSEDRQSEEVQSAYKKDSGGDEMLNAYFSFNRSEEQNEENEWSWVPQDADPLAESISSLQTTQEVLESEMQKLSELGKELDMEESSAKNKEKNVFVFPDVLQKLSRLSKELGIEEPGAENSEENADVSETNQKMKRLEQKLKEASNTIREKDLRLSTLQELLSGAHTLTPQNEATNIDQLVLELEHRLQEKIEAEVQCVVMMKARQSWQVRAEDQAALEKHKLSSAEDTRLLRKLRDTESKILMLREQVQKLEVHEKELFGTTEMLRMQSRTFKICFFGLVQLAMLFLSLKMFMQASVPFGDDVPT